MNKTDIIILNLEILYDYETINNNFFKARAYKNVIDNLYDKNIYSIDDLNNIEGIGIKIKEKIKELLLNGFIKKIEDIKKDKLFIFKKKLLSIYGIGPSNINNIINKHNIKTIDELEKNKNILNNLQLIGLKYYKDLEIKIPHKEVINHHILLSNELNKYYDIKYEFVGSFRRNIKNIGDLDIIIRKNDNFNLNIFINNLIEKNYIIEKLANGNNKFMGICKLNKYKYARRIDILVVPNEEYYWSLLYFTGSYKFNIVMRKMAHNIGYSLSEHGLKIINNNLNLKIPVINCEKDIFTFFNIKYIEPKDRINLFSIYNNRIHQ